MASGMRFHSLAGYSGANHFPSLCFSYIHVIGCIYLYYSSSLGYTFFRPLKRTTMGLERGKILLSG